jgi:folate-binding Fe-S cluster repair protein YgfZ
LNPCGTGTGLGELKQTSSKIGELLAWVGGYWSHTDRNVSRNLPLWSSHSNIDVASEASDHDIASSDDYLLHRILHGVPEGHTDIPAMNAFPMESNLDMMGAGIVHACPKHCAIY